MTDPDRIDVSYLRLLLCEQRHIAAQGGAGNDSWPYTAPNENGADDERANPAKSLVELRGIEPLTLRLPERSGLKKVHKKQWRTFGARKKWG